MEDKWQELRELESQRSNLTTKLAKIEEKKETVSSEVYSKVKKEYTEKLKTLDEKMTKYMDLIKEELLNIEKEVTTVVQEEKEIDLKTEETELRYSIGEYDEETYNELSKENSEHLSTIKEKKQKLEERKQWLSAFVQIKDIEETIESKAPEPEPEAEIKIEEHILEEKLPEEATKLDELLVKEETVKPEPPVAEEAPKEKPAKIDKEKEKNISCPKCGHLNAPDSWYCEKCGAEILDSPVLE